MKAVDYILDGLERELALERLLGVRTVEIDRSLLVPPVPPAPRAEQPAPESAPRAAEPDGRRGYDFVFLHDRALSPGAVEMMAKIVKAMGSEDAPILFTGGLPKAKVYIALGEVALRKWFPGAAGGFGDWIETSAGEAVLITRSPEFFLRFSDVTAEVKAMKLAMWNSLKDVLKRVKNG